MKYNAPPGSINPNAPYITGRPGIQKGSAVPAEAIEYPQREIVNVIKGAGLEPSNANLGQLLEAIKVLQGDTTGAMPLLSILWDPSSVAKPGYLDASQYHGLIPVSTFPEAAAEIQRRFEAGDSAVVADNDWLAECEANGVCPKFSVGDGQQTFRIPYMPGLYPGAPRQGQAAGDYLADQFQGHSLGNTTEGVGQTGAVPANTPLYTNTGDLGHHSTNISWGNTASIYLESGQSKFASTAEKLAIVSDGINGSPRVGYVTRPATAVMTPFIKMYGTVTEEGEANVAALIEQVTQLSRKIDSQALTKVWISPAYEIAHGVQIISNHNLGLEPSRCLAEIKFQCAAADLGYVEGDWLMGGVLAVETNDNFGNSVGVNPSLEPDAVYFTPSRAETGVYFRGKHKTTGAQVAITNANLANWRVQFRIFY